jgi:signal transduction histidine kinase
LQICVFIDPSIDCRVSGDAGRLRQILLNLLSNAVKFSHNGDVLLEVSVDKIDNSNGPNSSTARTFRFSCIDEGIGISAAGINKLFKRFSQVVSVSDLRLHSSIPSTSMQKVLSS